MPEWISQPALPWILLILFCLVMFAREFRAKIPGLKRFDLSFLGGKGSAEFDTPAPPEQKKPLAIGESLSQPLADSLGDELTKIQEERARGWLAEKSLTKPEDREIYLIRRQAIALVNLDLESIFNRIFGTQLHLMWHLNQVGSMTWDTLREEFAAELAKPESRLLPGIELEHWFRYLTDSDLVKIENNIVTISSKGKLFLAYLTLQAYTTYYRRG